MRHLLFLLMCDLIVLNWNFKMKSTVVMVPGWFRLIGEVLRVRNKFSADFFVFRLRFYQALFLCPCMKRCVFSKEELILSHIVLELKL